MTNGFDKARRGLREFSRGFPNEEETRTFIRAFINRNEDRVTAIMLASLLEDALTVALIQNFKKLTKQEERNIFGPEMPLSTFSSKIKISYALGICDKRQFNNLDAIRHIRNAFSHSKRPRDFSTQEISKMCEFIEPKKFARHKHSELQRPMQPKFRFLSESILILEFLTGIKIWDKDPLSTLSDLLP